MSNSALDYENIRSLIESTSAPSWMPDMNSYLNQIIDITSANNAEARAMAQEQRSWQERMIESANRFSMIEAEKNRKWQEMMANTAHQRQVADLKAAGLNPILAATGGAPIGAGATAQASMGSGASAQPDRSAVSAVTSMLGSFLNVMNRMAEMQTNAITNLAVADKYTAMSEITANISALAQKYSADVGYMGRLKEIEGLSERQKIEHAFSEYLTRNYPQSGWQILNTIINGIFGKDGQGGYDALSNYIKEKLGIDFGDASGSSGKSKKVPEPSQKGVMRFDKGNTPKQM